MSGVLPLGPGVQVLDLESVDPTILSIAHSGRVQARKLVGQKWKVTVRWPRLKRTEFRAIFAFLAAQRGQFETFTVVPPVISVPEGVATGTPVVRCRQNLLTYSEQLDNAAWWVRFGGNATVTPNVASPLAPDGSQTVEHVTATNGVSGVGEAIATVAGQQYCFSIWVQTFSGAPASVVALTVSNGSAGADPRSLSVVANNGALIRYSLAWTETVTGTRYVGVLVDVGGAYYAWGGQFESGLYPGPYIKTEASAITSEAPSGLTLHTDGWTPNVTGILKTGDLFKLAGNNKVYMLASDANSDAGGMATLSLTSPLVATPADNEAITKTAVPFVVRMVKDSIRYRYSGALVDLEADFIEDLA